MKENAFKCETTCGPPPLGYDFVDKKLVINKTEAEAIKLIYEMCAEGYGYGKIIDRLRNYAILMPKSFYKINPLNMSAIVSDFTYKKLFAPGKVWSTSDIKPFLKATLAL